LSARKYIVSYRILLAKRGRERTFYRFAEDIDEQCSSLGYWTCRKITCCDGLWTTI